MDRMEIDPLKDYISKNFPQLSEISSVFSFVCPQDMLPLQRGLKLTKGGNSSMVYIREFTVVLGNCGKQLTTMYIFIYLLCAILE